MKGFKKIVNFPLFFQFLKEGDKHLVLVGSSELKKIEDRFCVSLGTSKPNKIRPAIFWKSRSIKEAYHVVFLTASKKTAVRVNLDLCEDKKRHCKDFVFYMNSFVFQKSEGRFFCILLKTISLISNFYYCGKCKDLEVLDELPFFEF